MGNHDKTVSDTGKTTRKKSAAPKATAKKGTPKAKTKAKGTTKSTASAKTKSGREGTARKPAVRKRAPVPTVATALTPQERWQMIAEAAYLRAEQRGFTGGSPVDDWLAAEAEIDHRLSSP